MAQRITKALKVVSKENVIAILVIWGYSQTSAQAKADAGYDLALKAMPSDNSKGLAEYIACCY